MPDNDSSWSKEDCIRHVIRSHRYFLRCLQTGTPATDERFLELHEDLLPELRDALTKSRAMSQLQESAQQERVTVKCPQCQSHIQIVAKDSHRDIRCRSCQHTFRATEGSTVRVAAAEYVGQRLGPFVLLEKIGQGGFGRVWKAIDTILDRTVALKLATGGDPEDQERFVREAQAAAKLKHPNLVEVYRSDELPPGPGELRGQHYIASRFVSGGSLRRKLVKDTKLAPHEAATLVLKLARAVQHAHEHDIVHRDLKPENILLDEAGEPFITDFGLAKLLSRNTLITRENQVMGSPAYMSPEQAAGKSQDVGPASDIYSLGAILYELLTGLRTFPTTDFLSLMRQVQEELPPPPRTLCSSINPDIDTLCMQCLQKKASDRFATAREFADELERFLAGEPILSRPISNAKKVWRWCQRKPVMASLIGGTAATVLTSVVFVASAWVGERSARAAAESRRREAIHSLHLAHDSLGTAYLRLGSAFRLFPELNAPYRDFLIQGIQQYEQLATAASDDPQLELERGRVWLIVGDLHSELADDAAAAAAYQQANTVFENTQRVPDTKIESLTELANGRARQAAVAIRRKDRRTGCSLSREAVDALSRLHQQQPLDEYVEYSLAAAQLNCGSLLMEGDDTRDARALLISAAGHLRGLTARRPQRIDWLTDYVKVLTLLGYQASQSGEHEQAIEHIRTGLSHIRELEHKGLDDFRFIEARNQSRVYLAQALDRAGQIEAALAEYSGSVGDWTRLAEQAPSIARIAEERDLRVIDWAQALLDAGQLKAAFTQLDTVRKRVEQALKDYPDSVVMQYLAGLCWDNLGRVYADQGKNDLSEKLATQSVEVFRKLTARKPIERDHHLRLAISVLHLGEVRIKLDRLPAASESLDEAESILARLREADRRWDTPAEIAVFCLKARGRLCFQQGDRDAARQAHSRAIEQWKLLTESNRSPRSKNSLAKFLLNVPEESLRNPQLALKYAEELCREIPQSPRYQALQGAAACEAENWKLAKRAFDGVSNRDCRAADWLYRARLHWHLQEVAEAQLCFASARELLAEEGPDNRDLQRLGSTTAKLLQTEWP